jgi:CDP-glycerol glycerophosphotransferase (TagB/SpsB family)
MNRSDLMITDISSVLNEYLITRKPIILMNTRAMSTAELERQFPSTRACYLLTPEASVLEVMDTLRVKDTKHDDRAWVRKQSLGEHPEGAMACFNQIIAQAVNTKPGESC